ncbi:MAG: acyltransferase [Acidobacteriia bacterium]|nr:acyltransferase [Terriglobia bacterium]
MSQTRSPNSLQTNLIRPVMPELDSVRGVAILGVLFLHGFYWQYSSLHFTGLAKTFLLATQPGWLGVNLFFVLSGFLITGILLDSKHKPQYYRRFYTRRALRILPAYYLLLVLLALLHSASVGFLGLSFVYLANVTSLFGIPTDYGPLWSLAVEEHYYIFWPAVVQKLTPKRLAICSIALCVAIPILRAVSFRLGYTFGLASYTWFVADGLAAGSLLAIVLRTSITRQQVVSLCTTLLVSGVILTVVGRPFGITTRERLLGAALQHTLIDIVFGGILLFVLLVGTSSHKRYVNNSMLRFLGYLSYGLYLIHLLAFRIYDKLSRYYWPQLQPSDGHFGLVVLRFVVAGGFAIGLAYLSRKYFEETFLRLKDRLTQAPVTELPSPAAVSSGNPPEEIPA